MSYTPLNNTVLTGTPEVTADISIGDDLLLASGSSLDWDGGAASLAYDPADSVLTSDVHIRVAAAPSADADLANKGYVDSVAMGLDVKSSVRVATQADLDLAAPGASIDGVGMVSGDRVLVKAQANPEENGIYIWNGAAAAMTRASDANTDAEVTAGMFTFVEEGTSADQGWVLVTDNPIELGVTELVFSQFSNAVIVSTLDSLTDVEVGGAVEGSALVWDGSNWVDTQAILLDDAGTKITVDGGAIHTEMQSNRFLVDDSGEYLGKLEADGVRFEGPNNQGSVTYDDGDERLYINGGSEIHMQDNVHMQGDVFMQGNTLLTGDNGAVLFGPDELSLGENGDGELEAQADFRANNLKTGGSVFIGPDGYEISENAAAGRLEVHNNMMLDNAHSIKLFEDFATDTTVATTISTEEFRIRTGNAVDGYANMYLDTQRLQWSGPNSTARIEFDDVDERLSINGGSEIHMQNDVFMQGNALRTGDNGAVLFGPDELYLAENGDGELEALADFRANNLKTGGSVFVGGDALQISENIDGELAIGAATRVDGTLYAGNVDSAGDVRATDGGVITAIDGAFDSELSSQSLTFTGAEDEARIHYYDDAADSRLKVENATHFSVEADLEVKRGLRLMNITYVNGSETLSKYSQHIVMAVTADDPCTVTLPANPIHGTVFQIKDMSGNAEANPVTIAGNGKVIDGAATFVMAVDYQSSTVIYDGDENAWFLI